MELRISTTRQHIRTLAADAQAATTQTVPAPLPASHCPGTGDFIAALNAATEALYARLHTQGEHASAIAAEQWRAVDAIEGTDEDLSAHLERRGWQQ